MYYNIYHIWHLFIYLTEIAKTILQCLQWPSSLRSQMGSACGLPWLLVALAGKVGLAASNDCFATLADGVGLRPPTTARCARRKGRPCGLQWLLRYARRWGRPAASHDCSLRTKVEHNIELPTWLIHLIDRVLPYFKQKIASLCLGNSNNPSLLLWINVICQCSKSYSKHKTYATTLYKSYVIKKHWQMSI